MPKNTRKSAFFFPNFEVCFQEGWGGGGGAGNFAMWMVSNKDPQRQRMSTFPDMVLRGQGCLCGLGTSREGLKTRVQNKNKPQINQHCRKGGVRPPGRAAHAEMLQMRPASSRCVDIGAVSVSWGGHPPGQGFWSGARGPPGPSIINEPDFLKKRLAEGEWDGLAYTLEKTKRMQAMGREALGSQAQMQLSCSKGLFCMRKHTRTRG